jgi:type IV pilus assembly protein PilO
MNLSDINLSDFDLREAGEWPLVGKVVLIILVVAAVLGGGYYFFVKDQLAELDRVALEEQKLRQEFIEKQRVAANLESFRAQLKQMEADLAVMLRQLPTGTEMPDLLEDVSNTGKRSGLEFELFKPEAEQPRDFYAAKPITIKAKGSYHQFGAFVSGVAALSRIVTLENATLTGAGGGKGTGKGAGKVGSTEPVSIQATLQTYRYMEEGSATAAGGQQMGPRRPRAASRRRPARNERAISSGLQGGGRSRRRGAGSGAGRAGGVRPAGHGRPAAVRRDHQAHHADQKARSAAGHQAVHAVRLHRPGGQGSVHLGAVRAGRGAGDAG